MDTQTVDHRGRRRRPSEARRNIRVLVVDDDDMDFLAVARLLRKPEGNCVFEAVQASTLADGFKCLSAQLFDIALVDYFLGADCGLDLVRRLGGRNAVTPVIVLTGSRDPKVIAEIIDSGVTNYLCKEFLDGERLRPLLLSSIDQHRVELELLHKSGVLIDKASPIQGLGYFDYQIAPDVLLWSRESYAIWGVVPGEFAPTREKLLALIHPDDRARFQDTMTQPDAVGEMEFRIVTKSRAERIVHTIISRIDDENGQPLRFHGTYHDVTASRRTEQKLHQQRRRYQQLFDNSDISLLLADCSELIAELNDRIAAGDDVPRQLESDKSLLHELAASFRFTDANRSAMAMFGIDAKSLSDGYALRPIRETLVRELAFALWHKAPSVRSECIIEGAQGARSAVFSLPVPVDFQEAGSVPVSVIDLTDLHNAEIANRANAAKSAFLARMSHELRTPLNGVLANIELLQGTNLTMEQTSLVSSARMSGDTLLHLIGDILDFSKIEAGKVELEHVPFRLPEIFFDLEAMFRARAMSQDITFSWRIDSVTPERIEGDPLRLKQVLVNLVSNAMRHTQEGGVRVHARSTVRDGGTTIVRFDIIDSGSGLDPANVARLFDPFEQADASTTRTHGGTGLGLAICKSIVELWGGEIGVDGAVGVGADFWFTIPVKVVEPAPRLSLADLAKIPGAAAMKNRVALMLHEPDESHRQQMKDLRLPYKVVANLEEMLRYCDAAAAKGDPGVGSSRVDLQACKLEYSIVSPK